MLPARASTHLTSDYYQPRLPLEIPMTGGSADVCAVISFREATYLRPASTSGQVTGYIHDIRRPPPISLRPFMCGRRRNRIGPRSVATDGVAGVFRALDGAFGRWNNRAIACGPLSRALKMVTQNPRTKA
jgi:hypothetical protein